MHGGWGGGLYPGVARALALAFPILYLGLNGKGVYMFHTLAPLIFWQTRGLGVNSLDMWGAVPFRCHRPEWVCECEEDTGMCDHVYISCIFPPPGNVCVDILFQGARECLNWVGSRGSGSPSLPLPKR
jgi:hypothetical protein